MASAETQSPDKGGSGGSCGCSDLVVDQMSSISLKDTPEVNKEETLADDADPSTESSSKGDDDGEVALNKTPTSAWTCLEDYKRFSESILWSFMMNFYGASHCWRGCGNAD